MKKFNSKIRRAAFWDALTRHFDAFSDLLKPPENLSPDEVRTLKDIHTLLYECCQASKARLRKIRKEIKQCTLNY